MQIWYFPIICSLFFPSEVTISFDDFIHDVRCEFIICSYFNHYDFSYYGSVLYAFGYPDILNQEIFFLSFFFFWQINKTSQTILLLLHKALLELSDFGEETETSLLSSPWMLPETSQSTGTSPMCISIETYHYTCTPPLMPILLP